MTPAEAFNERAKLVLAQRRAGRSLRECVAIFALRGPEAARYLQARGHRLEREAQRAALPACPQCQSASFRDGDRGVWCSNENCRTPIAL